jgi:phasin family protein
MATKKAAPEFPGKEAFDAMNPEAFKEGYEKLAAGMSKFAEFNKETAEAVMESAGAYAKGLEQAASEQASFLKTSYEDGVAAAKSASTAKSVQEALEIQTEFARSAMEANLAFASKLTDHWTGVAKSTSDPLTKRFGAFVEAVQAYRP